MNFQLPFPPSQGRFLTALKLWDMWQARHSAADIGPAIMSKLLVAYAEVRASSLAWG